MDILIEAIAVIAVFVTAGLVPDNSGAAIRKATAWLGRVGRNKAACIAAVGLLTFGMAAAMSLAVRMPIPEGREEQAILLGADTFALGRLTNPTHELWESFETFDVFHQPTYQMKFQPGQSLMLALGQVIWHPILGVWIAVALATAATAWMLYAWLPPRWALLTSLLVLLNFRILRFWGQMYWGGALAMLGGALLFGAALRIGRKPTISSGLLFGLGGGILALTRPYEGLLAFFAAAVIAVLWSRRHEQPVSQLLLKAAAPAGAVLLAFAGWMGYYNHAVTGSPFKFPHQQYVQTYGERDLAGVAVPAIGGVHDPKRTIQVPEPNEDVQELLDRDERLRGQLLTKIIVAAVWFLGIALLIPIVPLWWARKSAKVQAAGITGGIVLLAVIVQANQGRTELFAPVVCLLFYLVGEGLRRLWQWEVKTTPIGPVVVCGLPLAVLLALLLGQYSYANQPDVQTWTKARQDLIEDLTGDRDSAGGKLDNSASKSETKHLVVVRYFENHYPKHEWVYNAADIDNAAVVWARELSPEQNRKLLEYYPDRQVWLLEADNNARLRPHDPTNLTGASGRSE